MKHAPEVLYHVASRLIETMPEFGYGDPISRDKHVWLGRVDALLKAAEGPTDLDQLAWRLAVENLNNQLLHEQAVQDMKRVLFRVFARLELEGPPSARGAFIPAANVFDAFSALAKIIGVAKQDVLIVDPYLDETVLTEFGGAVPPGISCRLMADESGHKPSVLPAARKWVSQHGSSRALQLRLAPARAIHDRAIFVDRSLAWTLTQSLKDFAKRSPAEIVRADDTASMKIAAYEAIWESANPVI